MTQDKVIRMLRNALAEKGFESLYMAQPKPLTIKEQYEGCEVSNCSLPFVPPPICGRRGMYHPHVRFIWVDCVLHRTYDLSFEGDPNGYRVITMERDADKVIAEAKKWIEENKEILNTHR